MWHLQEPFHVTCSTVAATCLPKDLCIYGYQALLQNVSHLLPESYQTCTMFNVRVCSDCVQECLPLGQ